MEKLETAIQELLDHGIISMESAISLHEEMENKKRKQILEKHPYPVWKNKRGYYVTEVNDPSKPRGIRQVARKNKKELEDYIINIIKEDEYKCTFADVYQKYRSICRDCNYPSPATINKYDSDFKRFYISQGWDTKAIEDTSMEEMIDFLEQSVGKMGLNAKAFAAMKTLTKKILKRARRDKLIDYNYDDVFTAIEVRPKKEHKDPESQVFTETELPIIIRYLVEHVDVHNLCLLLMILTGIRVGEMATLQYEDFLSDTCFEVKRTQTRWKDEEGHYHYEVKEAPKTEAGFRKAFIPEDYAWILSELRKMRPFSIYLATNEKGERMNTEALRKRLYRVCEKCEFPRKSTHKARKTFCSIILDAGFDRNLVISLMGHTDINTSENYYHFDRKSSKEKQNKINNLVDFKMKKVQ